MIPPVYVVMIMEQNKWRPELRQSILTYNEHTNCVYSTIWSPYNPDIFGSVSGDQLMKIWDTKVPTKSAQTIHGHLYEILSLDWNKYQENQFVTGSVDKIIKIWDLRFPNREVMCLMGHEYAAQDYPELVEP
nr:4091_t:CDS:2 [Entrophospora candida]